MSKYMATSTYGVAGKDITVFLDNAFIEAGVGNIRNIQKDLSIQEAESLIADLQHAIHVATSLKELERFYDESNI